MNLTPWRVTLSPEEMQAPSLSLVHFVAMQPEGYRLFCTPWQVQWMFASRMIDAASTKPKTDSINYRELEFLRSRYGLQTPQERRRAHRELRTIIRDIFRRGELVAHCIVPSSVIPEPGDAYEHLILTRDQERQPD